MTKKLVILGAGISGIGAAILGQHKGMDVFVSDYGSIAPKFIDILNKHQIRFEQKTHTQSEILEAELVVKSPGIPDKVPIVKALKAKGIPVISEVEFAARYTQAPIIAITGSNGKTTTTSLIYHLLKKSGINAALVGNIGFSFAEKVVEDTADVYVLEISSFQLDNTVDFHPHIAIITNITPDHLDRYNYDFQQYVQSKFQITKNQAPNNHLIYCGDDSVIKQHLDTHQVQAQTHAFSLKKNNNSSIYLSDQRIEIHNEWQIDVNLFPLQGRHNCYNAMAAVMAAKLMEVSQEAVETALSSFSSLEHRLEPVATINEVDFINDSKATNVDAVWYALDAMTKPCIWIVGGVDKGNEYEAIMELVQQKVKAIICLGVDNTKLHQTFQHLQKPMKNARSAKESVEIAKQWATPGDAVLLSPACASFDLFNNYIDRGNQFKKAVEALLPKEIT